LPLEAGCALLLRPRHVLGLLPHCYPVISLNLFNWYKAPTPDIFFVHLIPSPESRQTHLNWNRIIATRIAQSFPGRNLVVATDGSVSGRTAGCGVATIGVNLSVRLPDYTSAFAAECHAVDLALDSLLERQVSVAHDCVIIVCDCKSIFKYLAQGCRDANSFYFWRKIFALLQLFALRFVWVPSHVGYNPNEIADRLAKLATRNVFDGSACPGSISLPKFLVPRENKRVYTELRDRWLLTLPPEYYHLRVLLPSASFAPFKHRSIEHFFIRLRLKRPIFYFLGARLASYTGFCLRCPLIPFDASHLFFDCPFFHEEQQNLRRNLQNALRVQHVNLDFILSCGVEPSNMVETANQISFFLFKVIRRIT